jgi:hypothetical protein
MDIDGHFRFPSSFLSFLVTKLALFLPEKEATIHDFRPQNFQLSGAEN